MWSGSAPKLSVLLLVRYHTPQTNFTGICQQLLKSSAKFVELPLSHNGNCDVVNWQNFVTVCFNHKYCLLFKFLWNTRCRVCLLYKVIQCIYWSVADWRNESVDLLVLETLMPKALVQQYVSLVMDSKRLVLSGPTGTGKSYLAARLAQHIVLRYSLHLERHRIYLHSYLLCHE